MLFQILLHGFETFSFAPDGSRQSVKHILCITIFLLGRLFLLSERLQKRLKLLIRKHMHNRLTTHRAAFSLYKPAP